MKAYSEDLRQMIVQAVQQRGMSKSQAARLFGIGLSSLKRYARLASQGSLSAPEREVDGLLKPTRRPRSFSKRTYAQGRRPPSQTGVTSWRASPARLSANLP
jgi:transposase